MRGRLSNVSFEPKLPLDHANANVRFSGANRPKRTVSFHRPTSAVAEFLKFVPARRRSYAPGELAASISDNVRTRTLSRNRRMS